MRGSFSKFTPINKFLLLFTGSPVRFLFSKLGMQIWLATGTLRGSFATFSPKPKIFWYSFVFLGFSVQIYFQQVSFWVGFTGWLGVLRRQIRAVAKFISSNAKYYVKA
jgi:hypothetical protein